MKTFHAAVIALALVLNVRAADSLTERLQRGLFEEEANHNLDAAIKEYQSVVVQSDEQRKVIVERYAAKRAELKKTLVDPNATDEAREAARVGLQKLPRDASPVRLRNRDAIDGRPRGNLSKFGISRVRFRDMAHRGELPGITKSSW